MIIVNSLLLIIAIIMLLIRFNKIDFNLDKHSEFDIIENKQFEIIIESFNSYNNILRYELKDKYDTIMQIINSTLQSLYENKDFDTNSPKNLIDDSLDIVQRMIDYNKIIITKKQELLISVIIKSMIRIFRINLSFCSRLIAG